MSEKQKIDVRQLFEIIGRLTVEKDLLAQQLAEMAMKLNAEPEKNVHGNV